MLLQVSGTNVLVYGSIHCLPEGEQVPQQAIAALLSSEDCIFESDLDRKDAPDFIRYPEGESINTWLTPEFYARVCDLCDRLEMSELLPGYKPWWVTLVLSIALVSRAGNDFERGVDRQLWEAAKQTQKSRFVLESSQVLRIFDGSPRSEQLTRLEYVVRNEHEASAYIDRLREAWRRADTAALDRELRFQMEMSPVTFQGLIRGRNEQWIHQILHAIRRNRRAVFIVGILHLAGEFSLQHLLRRQGFVLRPV